MGILGTRKTIFIEVVNICGTFKQYIPHRRVSQGMGARAGIREAQGCAAAGNMRNL